MRISIQKDFATDFISREAGEKLRQLIVDSSKRNEQIIINFSKVQVASISFFDEAFAKLALEGWNETDFRQNITIEHLDPYDSKVLNQLCQYRGLLK